MTLFGARPSSYRPASLGRGLFGDIVLPAPAATSDLRQWCQPETQGAAEKCVGETLGGLLWLASRNMGKRPSAKGIYTDARARERARVTDVLPDFGCDPADAVDALVLEGPYPEDSNDNDMSMKDAVATWPEMSQRIRVDPSFIVEVEAGDLDTLDRYLSIRSETGAPAGFGFGFAMQVDASYEAWEGSAVYKGPTGPSLGGHMQMACGHDGLTDDDAYWVCGSWGPGLGVNGFTRIQRRFMRTQTSNLYVIRGSPIW